MKPETSSVHAGTRIDPEIRGVNTPIHTSSAFDYRNAEELPYPRMFSTPNQAAVVAKVAALEGAEDGVLFASGMAAISTSLFALLRPGDHVVFQEQLYGGTYQLVVGQLQRFGIEHSFAEPDVNALRAALRPNTRMIYLESPANPLLQVVDLAAVGELARSRGILGVIDSTFASPVNQTPLSFGFDLVIHSGTKYLAGHSDLCCGLALGRSELIREVRNAATQLGGSLNALSCYLLERSLKTLFVRVQRQNQNALYLAEALEADSRVARVYYPGLPSHPGHVVAASQMRGFGGMVSFDLAPSVDPGRFLDRLRLVQPALSLGGVESTLCLPASSSHRGVPEAERQRLGITPSTVRLSVGIEHPEDLLDDLRQALGG